MGLMSYHIALSPSPHLLTPHAIPGWVDELISQDFPQSWVSGVFSSTVATFSPNVPRVGIFVDPLDPPDKYGSAPPSIDWYCQFHVPVWYPWTSKHADEARRTDCIARLAPPPHVLQSGTTFLTRHPAPEFSSTAVLPIFQRQPTPATATSAAAAKQKAADWKQFFILRELRQKEILETETDEQRQIRLNRERQPPTTNTTVYKWVQSEDDPSQRIRERVSKRWNNDMLAEYGTRCRYNSFDNEWDLCSEFSGDGSDDDDDSMCAEDYEYPVEATLDENTTDEYIDSNPLNRSPSPVLDEPSHDIGASQNDLRETSIILADHYGFVPPLADLPTTPDSCQKWKRYRKFLGLKEQDVNTVSSLEQAAINFVESLINGRPGQHEWDLCDKNWKALASSARIFSVAESNARSSRVPQIFVLSSPRSSSCNWVLGLERAADLVFAFRSLRDVARNIYGVARLLIHQGIPFRTLRSLSPTPSFISSPVIVKTISFRLSDYKFTPYDYASYLRERSATLSQPNARAALLSGGILWRIAQEHLSVDAALEGPSRVVTGHRVGQSFYDVASHCTYWDDSVDEDVSNSICGLVTCYTGKLSSLWFAGFSSYVVIGNGLQVAKKSFYPLPSTWEQAGTPFSILSTILSGLANCILSRYYCAN